ncbi:Vesicle-associated membrane protein 711 [Vitis vinifera]|uniref:Vesicle-associated membrane protein 711 n=1 Tax=Vitis vinifera TaxID=29760 RepID=A0A438FZB0_VITVI|nr:Vesicle-associated membrane protein 711 [Vitis vinifera]
MGSHHARVLGQRGREILNLRASIGRVQSEEEEITVDLVRSVLNRRETDDDSVCVGGEGSLVLAEFSGTSTNASAIARQILEKIPGDNDSNVSYSQDRYIFM